MKRDMQWITHQYENRLHAIITMNEKIYEDFLDSTY